MRKTLLLAVAIALGAAGTAYAVIITNVYTMHAKVTPAKSGTRRHPKSIGTHVDWTITTTPKGRRPNIVKTYDITVQGIRENTNDFKACGSARLNDPSEGPTTCPRGSQIGKGFFIVQAGKPGDQTSIQLTCRAELSIYNASNHKLAYYVYKGSQMPGQPQPCPLPRNEAFNATLTPTGLGLKETFTVPNDLRHVTIGSPPYAVDFDVADFKASGDIPSKTTTLVHKRGKHTIKTKVGLFESISCPHNHQRQVLVKFTLENGHSHTSSRLVSCTP
jgi:hypothetical protein